MVAEVIIESSVKQLNRVFDYNIPADLNVKIGCRVCVPFGNKKEAEDGIVVNIKQKSEYQNKIKSIIGLQKEQIKDEYIELAKFMADRYFCNFSDCLKLMLPPGRTSKNVTNRINEKMINCISLLKKPIEVREDIDNGVIRTDRQKDVLEFLLGNDEVTMQDIELFTDATPSIVNTLIKKGYLTKKPKKAERNPFIHKNIVKSGNLQLNEEQKNAYNSVSYNGEYLLYGVTGSRKNRSVFTANRKNIKSRKNKYNACSRNFTYTTNC